MLPAGTLPMTRKRGEATALTLNCCLSETMTDFSSVSASEAAGLGSLRADPERACAHNHFFLSPSAPSDDLSSLGPLIEEATFIA